jgi:hypothetical protein
LLPVDWIARLSGRTEVQPDNNKSDRSYSRNKQWARKKISNGSYTMTALLLENDPVPGLIYYSVMIGNSSGLTYLIYLYSNGML